MQTQDIRVAVIACARTPFVKANTALREYSALELGRYSVDGLLEKAAFDPAMIAISTQRLV